MAARQKRGSLDYELKAANHKALGGADSRIF
jgi:hypothetical protein